jgi:CRP-like cAMP-binding protein
MSETEHLPFFFSEFQTAAFLAFARSVGTVVRYNEGQTIFAEEQAPHNMYVVLSGLVNVTRHDRRVETIGAGYAFGILSLLDEKPRAATVVASTECELSRIDRKKFRYLVEEAPNFAWYVMNQLADRLRATSAML